MLRSLVLGLMLVGAAHAAPSPHTKADKAVILDWFKRNLVDPYSIRSAAISDPMVGVEGVSIICVEYNAKSEAGGYVGIERMSFVQTPAGLVPSSRHTPTTNLTCYKNPVVLRPFPELEKLN